VADRALSLDLLRTFQAVYRAGTLTSAARLLGMSQPSVTGQLRALEDTIGQPLFLRRARGVVATPSGSTDRSTRWRRSPPTCTGPLRCAAGPCAWADLRN